MVLLYLLMNSHFRKFLGNECHYSAADTIDIVVEDSIELCTEIVCCAALDMCWREFH